MNGEANDRGSVASKTQPSWIVVVSGAVPSGLHETQGDPSSSRSVRGTLTAQMSGNLKRTIGVIGLGYVGLPVAVAFAERFPQTVGFDIDQNRVDELLAGIDRTREVDTDRLRDSGLGLTSDTEDLDGIDFFIVTVPTPIGEHRKPDLSAIRAASHTVGTAMDMVQSSCSNRPCIPV